MKLIFVHGINQDGKNSEQIKSEWSQAIRETSVGSKVLDDYDIVAPFYGDMLTSDLTKGPEDMEPAEVEFMNELANDMAGYLCETGDAQTRHVMNTEYFEETYETERGFPHNQLFLKFARAIQNISPKRGTVAMRFLKQAYTYYSTDDLRSEIDELVSSAIEQAGECVVISHSLGTVVSFRAIRDHPISANVKKYITLGSPLGLKSFRRQLGDNLARPDKVGSWLNAHDPRDFVSMGIALQDYYENVDDEYKDVRNSDEDPHAVSYDKGYLHDERILSWLVNS